MSKIELTTEQQAIAEQISGFEYVSGIHMETGASRNYKAKYKGMVIWRHVYTPKNRKSGNWGTGTQSFSIDNEKPEYKTVQELLNELIKRDLKIVR